MTIDYRRLARPQLDRYDSLIIGELAAERYPPYQAPGNSPVWGAPARYKFLDAIPLVELETPPSADYVNAPLNHPNLRLAEDLAREWPELVLSLQYLCPALGVITLATLGDDLTHRPFGCTCGAVGEAFGAVYSTIYDPVGYLEGIAHEVGHWRLHALGVHLESWSDLLDMAPEELFPSPIRKDKLRPMGAVVQAQYSYLFVTRIYQLAVTTGQFPNEERQYLESVRVNVARLEEGLATIEHARWTGEGQAFYAGMLEWTEEIVRDGHTLLR